MMNKEKTKKKWIKPKIKSLNFNKTMGGNDPDIQESTFADIYNLNS